MAIPTSLPELKYVYSWPSFLVDPGFDHKDTSPGSTLGYFPVYVGIGGQPFNNNSTWERYAQILDEIYDDYWPLDLHSRFRFLFEAEDEIFIVGFANKLTVDIDPFTENFLGIKFVKAATANKWVISIVVIDWDGNDYSITAPAEATMIADTFYRFHFAYEPVSREINLRITQDNGFTNVTQFSDVLSEDVHFDLDIVGVFNEYTGVPGSVNAYFTELFAINSLAYRQPPSLPREYIASIIHRPAKDDSGTMARDLIEMGVVRGNWDRRENVPASLNLEIMNVHHQHGTRFNIGDIITFYLGRDGILEPAPLLFGRIMSDLVKEIGPKRMRIEFTAFGMDQLAAGQKIWLWKRDNAPWLAKGYTFDPTPPGYTDVTNNWNTDDNITAQPPNEIDAAAYVGFGVKHNGIRYELRGGPGSFTGTVAFEYWDFESLSWQSLDVYEDSGSQMNNIGTFVTRWHLPKNWGPMNLSPDGVERYWIRIRTTGLGGPGYMVDWFKIVADYENLTLDFVLKDLFDSIYGCELNTEYIMATDPPVLITADSGITASGSNISEVARNIVDLAYNNRYPYGSVLPYFLQQDYMNIVFKPHKDPDESPQYIDLVLGENLKRIREVQEIDKMGNENIVSGDADYYAPMIARDSIIKHCFIRTQTGSLGPVTSEGQLRDAAIKNAQLSKMPYKPLFADVVGSFSTPIGAIARVSGAGEYDGKYIVRQAIGGFDPRNVRHTLVLGDKQTTVLEAVDG